MKKKITWQSVYKLPLKYDDMCYAWSKNKTMSLMFDFGMSEKDKHRIVDVINGDSDSKIENLTHDECDFKIGGKYAFCVRGWGHLTGIGGLNLPEEEAASIQDGFIDYVYNKLKK